MIRLWCVLGQSQKQLRDGRSRCRPGRGLAVLLLLVLGLTITGQPGGNPRLRGAHAQGQAQIQAQSSAEQAFSFVHIADPHIGSAAGNKFTPQVVTEVAALPEKPAFVVVGGDLTELGSAEQYDAFQATADRVGVPVYPALGNHESRWLDSGKGNFINRYGRRYYDFSHRGMHFVVLDTSVSNQTHGHCERLMLDWLRERLAEWGRGAPVVVFMHHPVGYPGQRFVDNEQDFLEAVEGYNVVAVFTGHGHINAAWRRNGIQFFMTRAAMEGGYAVVRVAEGVLSVYTRVVGEEPVLAAMVPLAGPIATPPRVTTLTVVQPSPGRRITGDFTLQARVSPGEATLEYRVDGGTWLPLGDAASPGAARAVTVPTAGLAPGFHDVTVRATLGDDVWTREVRVLLDPAGERAGPAVTLAWRYPTGGAIQSSPAVDTARGVVYFGSNDGALRCVGMQDGKKRWQVWTSGTILSAPCLGRDTVYFGASDGRVTAVDAGTGKVRWQFACRGAIVGSPLLGGDTLFFGDGEGIFHAVDARTGAEKWQFRTGGLIRSGATWGRGMVYFGSWDGHVYALEAATGRLVWKRNLARQVYYAPVGGTPLFYLDKLFVTTPSDPHGGRLGVHALDATTGEIVWQSMVPGGLSSPQVHNLAVAVNSAGGKVCALHPLTGEVWWEATTGLTVYDSSLVPYGGDAVLGGLWGEVVAWNCSTGQETWRYRLGYRLLAARAAAGEGYVFVPSLDGCLYALKVEPSPLPALAPAFPDTVGHWAQDAVARVARLGLMRGYEEGSYRPGAPMTRAEMAAVMARYLAITPAEGLTSRFADVRGHWAEPFIGALEERGLVRGEAGSDGTTRFRPDDPVSRAELAAMLGRLCGLTAPSSGFATRFYDVQTSWARDFILAMEEQGLVKGTRQGNKTMFRPQAHATRAEVAVLLSRVAR